MPDLPVSEAQDGRIIRFLQENASGEMQMVDIHLHERRWSVTDPEARAMAAEKLLGEAVDEWWTKHAQWFINEEKNAAGLAVYRWKTPANIERWEKDTGQRVAPR